MTTTLKVKQIPVQLMSSYSNLKTPEERKVFLSLLSYFKDLCSNLEIPIESIDLMKIVNSSGQIIEKRAINKLLMSSAKNYEAEASSGVEKNLLGFEIELLNKFNKDFAEKGTGKKWAETIARLRSDIESMTRTISVNSREIFELSRKMQIITSDDGYSKKIIEEIDKIVKCHDFVNVYFDKSSNLLHATTKTNCILSGPDGSLDFGKYNLIYSLTNSTIHFAPFEANIIVENGWIHPHLFADFQMCYGSATAAVGASIEEFELSKIFAIANLILHDYNPDSPTINLRRFIDEGAQMTDTEYKTFYSGKMNASYCHKNLRSKLYPAWKMDSSKILEMTNKVAELKVGAA